MASKIAYIRFIADSMDYSFRGSNDEEQKQIEMVRNLYAKYLFDDSPPKQIVDRLYPLCKSLIEAADFGKPVNIDALVSMYNPT